MKDILKLMGSYFAVGFGTLVGIGAGMKVCDKLLKDKEDDNTEIEKEKVIKLVKESE